MANMLSGAAFDGWSNLSDGRERKSAVAADKGAPPCALCSGHTADPSCTEQSRPDGISRGT